jgi:hypothetical protein
MQGSHDRVERGSVVEVLVLSLFPAAAQLFDRERFELRKRHGIAREQLRRARAEVVFHRQRLARP